MLNPGQNCVGCFACYSVCQQKAISMIEDEEGFLVPKINQNKCSNCGTCEAVCPLNHKNPERKPFAVFAAKHSNEETKLLSSSGGIFSAFAEKIIAENGVVFGAKFNENMEVIHGFTETIEGLAYFRGSKYVQSKIGESYLKAKDFLDSGRKVLFTGTPCQIAGLKSFLQKDYENLLTIDLICHGVPSPLLWKKYLESVVKKYIDFVPDLNITKAFFREKKESWEKFNISVYGFSEYLNRNFEIISENLHKNLFLQSFLNNLCLRKTCYSCQFKSLKSGSDITIGDFWGIKEVLPDFYDQNGVSLALLNSEKGQSFFDGISSIISHGTNYESAVKNNSMIEQSVKKPIERESFFKGLKFPESATLQKKNSLKIGILTNLIGSNYGGILQAYALFKTLKDFGHNPIFIKRTTQDIIKRNKVTIKTRLRASLRQFIKKYVCFHGDSWAYLYAKKSQLVNELNYVGNKITSRNIVPFISRQFSCQTTPCINSSDLKEQTKNCDGIIVGSDQVWRPEYTLNIYDNFCDFLGDSSIKRFSYAASFGTDDWRYTDEETSRCKELLKKFITVSVRESDGVDKCQKYFNRQATHVLDPTMLLTKDFCEKEFVETKSNNENFVFSYILDKSDQKTEILERLSNTLNKKYKSIIWSEYIKEKNSLPSIETWLSNYSQADFIFTDSFHGTVFSIIFNKPFITFMNKERGNTRFTSLLEMFNLKNRLITEASELTEEKILAPIDWNKVNIILELEREKSLNFLKNCLAEIVHENHIKMPKYSLKRFIGKILRRFL